MKTRLLTPSKRRQNAHQYAHRERMRKIQEYLARKRLLQKSSMKLSLIFGLASLAIQVHAEPLIITHGGIYSGVYSSDDPAVPAVIVTTGAPVELSNCTIISVYDGVSVSVPMGNLSIHDCHFISKGDGAGVIAANIQGINISNNYFERWRSAVDLSNPVGSPFSGARFVINNNRIVNVQAGAILIAGLMGILQGEIGWNEVINDSRSSVAMDEIDIYDSTGQPNGPIRVHDNYIEGVSPSLYASDWNSAGILTDGDPPAARVSWYVLIDNNTVVNATTGITLAYGHYCTAENNRVVSMSRDWRSGSLYPFWCQGIQIYISDSTNLAQNNVIGVNGGTTYQSAQRADTYAIGGSGVLSGNTSLHDGFITKSDEDQELANWHHKVWYYGQQIGPR